jgi:hypothetical protein
VFARGEVGLGFIAEHLVVTSFRARQGSHSRVMGHDMAAVWRQGGR